MNKGEEHPRRREAGRGAKAREEGACPGSLREADVVETEQEGLAGQVGDEVI